MNKRSIDADTVQHDNDDPHIEKRPRQASPAAETTANGVDDAEWEAFQELIGKQDGEEQVDRQDIEIGQEEEDESEDGLQLETWDEEDHKLEQRREMLAKQQEYLAKLRQSTAAASKQESSDGTDNSLSSDPEQDDENGKIP